MSLFSDLSNAKTQSRGTKITEPALDQSIDYIVRTDDIKVQESNQGYGTLFIAEFTIMQGTELNPPGAERSWVQMPTYGKRKNTDPGNIKQYVGSLMGLVSDDPEVPAAEFDKATTGGFNGTLLRLAVKHIKTGGGYDFFQHTWSPFTGDPASLASAPVKASAAPAPAPTSAAPAAPSAPPVELTKETWLAGEGPGTEHPTNPAYEWNMDHSDWGIRPKV